MNSNWFIALGIALVMGVFGLVGAAKQVQLVGLWWDQRDGPDTAMASALAPLIDCVNRVDRDTRLVYYRRANPDRSDGESTLRPAGYPDNRTEFGDTTEPDARVIQKDVCGENISLKLKSQQPDSRLVGVADRFVPSLDTITALTYPSRSSAPQSAAEKRLFNDNMMALLRENMLREGAAYLSISAELRRSLEREEQRLRPAQLTALQARFGEDLHWHVLNYMIAARQAINQIDQGMRNASLTPQTLAALTAAVQVAGEKSHRAVKNVPRTARDEDAAYLWYSVKPSVDAYLEAMQALLNDWLDHASPQQLSDDYYVVARRYDSLLSYYNRQARNTF
jgi:hypothetical protein